MEACQTLPSLQFREERFPDLPLIKLNTTSSIEFNKPLLNAPNLQSMMLRAVGNMGMILSSHKRIGHAHK